MALWGVSGLDVKNAGWNGAVGLAVGAGCFGVVWCVKKLALLAHGYFYSKKQSYAYATYGSFAVGVGVAILANKYVSNSRFALITNASISKMLKLGAVQTVVGFILDCLKGNIAENTSLILTAVGTGTALAGYCSKYALFGFGAAGALLGSIRYPYP
jgi:hypothetical protein